MKPDVCPVCGSLVPARATACPDCGADEKTGWSDAGKADQLGIPDDSFDYNEFLEEEFAEKKDPHKAKFRWYWAAAAILLILLFLGLLRGW